MAQATISPTNKAVTFSGKAKKPKGLKSAAAKLAKAGKISPKAMKKVMGA